LVASNRDQGCQNEVRSARTCKTRDASLVRAKAGLIDQALKERRGFAGEGPREARSNKSGSIVVKISEEQFHFCELQQASTRLPPTSAQVLGESREQTL